MNFGIALPNYGPAPSRQSILDTTQAAEALGFHSVWLTDHLAIPQEYAARFGHLYEAISTLAYLAALTTRLRLGISVLILPQRNPLEIAKQLATIDVLSGGRVNLAVGVGWCAEEFFSLGYNFHNRGARIEEAIHVLRTAWSGEQVVSYRGKYYNFSNVFFSPAPIQPGGPPIWVGGDSKIALQRAVRLADGWHPHEMTPEAYRTALAGVEIALGRRNFPLCPRMHIAIDGDAARAGLSGSPEQIIAQLKEYHLAGVDTVVLVFDVPSQAARIQAVERFAREVMPAL